MGTGRAEGQGQTQAKPEPGSLSGTQEGSGGTEAIRDLGGEAVMGNGSKVAMLALRGEGWRGWLDSSIRLSGYCAESSRREEPWGGVGPAGTKGLEEGDKVGTFRRGRAGGMCWGMAESQSSDDQVSVDQVQEPGPGP